MPFFFLPLSLPNSSSSRYFTFLTECTTPKACTILLRGPSKDILNEIDRNLADAMSVARNVVFNPTLVPGGGAVEMAISVGLHARARAVTGTEVGPFRAVADALEVIPRTLVQNAGGNAIRALTALRVRFFSSPALSCFDCFFQHTFPLLVPIGAALFLFI
jgi:chaperonin GroEL (HSP60 family)